MQIILSLYPSLNHIIQPSWKSQKDIGVKDGSNHVEPGVNRAQQFVIWMKGEFTIGQKVRECFMEGNKWVLEKAEWSKPKCCNSWTGVGPPLSVQIHLNGLMEDTITTISRYKYWNLWDGSYPLIVSLSILSRKSPFSFGTIFNSSLGDLA